MLPMPAMILRARQWSSVRSSLDEGPSGPARESGISAAFMNSSMSADEVTDVYRMCNITRYDCSISPPKDLDAAFLDRLKTAQFPFSP